MCGKSIKPNIPSTETNSLPPVNSPNEEIQLDFIGPMTDMANIRAGKRFGKALDLSLDVMKKTPHTKLKKSAFELHYGRKPNTEVTNLLSLDNLKNRYIH